MRKIPRVMLLIEVENEYGRGLLSGIAKYSNVYGPWTFYRTVPFVYNEYPFSRRFVDEKTIARLNAWNADGVIAHVSDKVAEKILKLGIPTIIATQSRLEGIVSLVADYLAIGRMAAEHFLNKGFQNFAFCGIGDVLWSQKRGEGFSTRLKEAGFEADVYDSPKQKQNCSWQYEQSYMAEWLKSLPQPVGVLACSDARAEQLIEACKIGELHVPEQVAILGVDNDKFICELSNPSLSSIVLDTETAGFEAAKILHEMMMGEKPYKYEIIEHPTHVEERTSTDILAVSDPGIAAALRFINEQIKEDIEVDDVAVAAMMSRRTLERRFKKVIGRTTKNEIRRVRVELMAKMLINTNLSIAQIALALGYPGVDHVARYFRQEKGMSPLAYRKKYNCQ